MLLFVALAVAVVAAIVCKSRYDSLREAALRRAIACRDGSLFRSSGGRVADLWYSKKAELRDWFLGSVESENCEDLRWLLREVPSLRSDRVTTAGLQRAAKIGNKDLVRAIVDNVEPPISGMQHTISADRGAVHDDPEIVELIVSLALPEHQGNLFYSAARAAAEAGNLGVLEACIGRFDKSVRAGDNSKTPLIAAVMGGNRKCVKALLDLGVDVNEECLYATALVAAVRAGNSWAVEMLLGAGAKPTRPGSGSWTLLHIAAREGYWALIQPLVRAGIDPDSDDFDGLRSIYYAIKAGHMSATIELLNAGASIDTASLVASTKHADNEITSLLLRRGCHEGVIGAALERAAADGDVAAVSLLASYCSDNKLAASMSAVRSCKIGPLKVLSFHGVDPKDWSNGYKSPLEYAVEEGAVDFAVSLLALGPEVSGPPEFLTRLAVTAARRGDYELVELLLRFGAKADGSEDMDTFPLLASSMLPYGGVTNVSLSRTSYGIEDADFMVNSNGAIYQVKDRCDPNETVRVLLAHGADVNRASEDGVTALMAAAKQRNDPLVAMLLDEGADPHARDKNGESASEYVDKKYFHTSSGHRKRVLELLGVSEVD